MKRLKVGVIPSAGKGTRLGYLNNILPKPLFPIYDKPIIHHVVDNMINAGIEEIYIPVSHQKDKIIGYFKEVKNELDAKIHFTHVNIIASKYNRVGLAMSIYTTKEYISEPFMTILGDDCTITNSFHDMINSYFDNHALVVEGLVKEENIESIKRSCCVVLKEDNRIEKIIEKPDIPTSNLRGCGVYIFDESIYDYIDLTPVSRRNEVEITQTIDIISQMKKAYGYLMDGVNININTYDDLVEASMTMKKIKDKNI